jgi:hypothetical protein
VRYSRSRVGAVRQDPDTHAGEREALAQYLDYQRETILLKAEGLDKDQLARKLPICSARRSTAASVSNPLRSASPG